MMGSTSSSLLNSHSFQILPENPSLISLKPQQQNQPCQLPLHSVSSTSTNAKSHQLLLNPLFSKQSSSSSSSSSTVMIKTNPCPFLVSDDDNPDPVSVVSVICPALAYANIYFCKPYNVQIIPREDEEMDSRFTELEKERLVEKFVKRFRYAAANACVFHELKRRKFFESPLEKKMTKAKHAAKVLKRAKIRAGGGLRKPRILIGSKSLEGKKRKARMGAAKRVSKKKRAELRQNQKGSSRNNIPAEEKKESYNSDDDNWEFQEVELPYC